MLRNLAFAIGCAVSLIVLCTAASLAAADFGTPEEAKAMLEKAVAAVKQDKAKALDAFNAGEAGFKDPRSLCVVRQRIRRHHDGASLRPKGQTAERH